MQTVINTPLAVFNMPQYLVIPLFQRPYVWTEDDQWEPLWADIRRMAELRILQPGTQSRHFLGAIVVQAQELPFGNVTTHEVIDGQQRLTTLQLVFDATAAVFTDLGQEAYASQLNTFTHNDSSFVQQGMPLLKLRHTNKDRDAFLEVMDAPAPVEYDALPHKASRIVQAHEYFAGVVSDWLGTSEDSSFKSRAESLVGVLASGLQMVVITLGAEENSQEIFETLNARGTPLTAADLIKNFVFQRLQAEGADTQEAYEKVWPFDVKFWEKDVSVGRYLVSRSSLFLNQWLVSRAAEEVGLQSTFSRFKSYVEHDAGISMLELLHQLRDESEMYQAWHEAAASSDRSLDVTEMCFYRMAAVDSHVLKPLLLWLHAPIRSVPSDQRERAIKAAESWMMRRALLRLNSADSSRIIADLIRGLLGAAPDEITERLENHLTLLDSATTYWPGDAELERALGAEPVYKRLSARRLRPVLEAIEDEMRLETGSQPVTRWALAIEHILPQAWPENWPVEGLEAESTRESVVHRLGNLTLLTGKLNSKVSNSAWNDKRSALQQHNTILLNARMLASTDASTWDEAAIALRTSQMVKAIQRIWPVPEGHVGEVVGPRGRSSDSVAVADLVIAGLLEPGTMLRLGRSEFAHVTAKVCDDGDIDLNGKRYGSPSGAAWEAMRRATNGWYDWTLEDGRRLHEVRSVYLGKAKATSRASFDWQRLHGILEALPVGSWTTYGALAEALSTAAQAVANHLASCERCANPHRVLQADGKVAPGFAWADTADRRDPRELLEAEGIAFAGGVADPHTRLEAEVLLGLAPDAAFHTEGINYFRVALGSEAMFLDDALAHGYIGTSWLKALDLAEYQGKSVGQWHAELNSRVKVTDDIASDVGAGLAVGQTWALVEQMQNGDHVLVPTGKSSYRVAVVVGPYQFVAGADVPHRRPVDWLACDLYRIDMSEELRTSLQFGGTLQNLHKYVDELRELISLAGSAK